MRSLYAPIMTFGRFKGAPIDVRTRRSAELIREQSSNALIRYFFHQGSFYTAKIPLEGVNSVLGQRFSFGLTNDTEKSSGNSLLGSIKQNLVNHAQVRFVFEKNNPVRLYHVDDEKGEDDALHELHDIIYSVEVVGPKGEKWSVKNCFGSLACAHRFLSTEEMFFERVLIGRYLIDQTPPLPFSPKEKKRALRICIQKSHSAGMNTPYYLVTPFFGASNCTSEAFHVLDSTMWPRYNLKQKCIAKTLWRFPISLEKYLSLRGIDLGEIGGVPFHEEYQHYHEREDLKERLRKIEDRKSTQT